MYFIGKKSNSGSSAFSPFLLSILMNAGAPGIIWLGHDRKTDIQVLPSVYVEALLKLLWNIHPDLHAALFKGSISIVVGMHCLLVWCCFYFTFLRLLRCLLRLLAEQRPCAPPFISLMKPRCWGLSTVGTTDSLEFMWWLLLFLSVRHAFFPFL